MAIAGVTCVAEKIRIQDQAGLQQKRIGLLSLSARIARRAESGHILIYACDRLYKTGADGDDAVEREIDFPSLHDLEKGGDGFPFSGLSSDSDFRLIFLCSSQDVLATALDMG